MTEKNLVPHSSGSHFGKRFWRLDYGLLTGFFFFVRDVLKHILVLNFLKFEEILRTFGNFCM